jgi:hypothetical protein
MILSNNQTNYAIYASVQTISCTKQIGLGIWRCILGCQSLMLGFECIECVNNDIELRDSVFKNI